MKIPIQIPDGQLDDYRFLINEIFIQQVYRVNLTNPNPLIIDVGANTGILPYIFVKSTQMRKYWRLKPQRNAFLGSRTTRKNIKILLVLMLH